MIPTRRALLLGASAAAASGCTKLIKLEPLDLRAATPSPAAGVSFRAFRNAGDRSSERVFDGEVVVELYLLGQDDRRELVHRSRTGSFDRDDLVPGDYELEILEVTVDGRTEPPEGQNHVKFTLEEGEVARVHMVVKAVPWATIVIVALIVVIVVALVVWAVMQSQSRSPSGGPGPKPPPLRPNHRPPRPPPRYHPPHVTVGIWVPIVWVDTGPVYVWEGGPPPWREGGGVETIIAPPPDRPADAVVVRFRTQMDAFWFDPTTLALVDEAGRAAAVGISSPDEGWSAHIRPLRPLHAGKWRVRVAGPGLTDRNGRSAGQATEMPFTIG
jgi:hypothetical protein